MVREYNSFGGVKMCFKDILDSRELTGFPGTNGYFLCVI